MKADEKYSSEDNFRIRRDIAHRAAIELLVRAVKQFFTINLIFALHFCKKNCAFVATHNAFQIRRAQYAILVAAANILLCYTLLSSQCT